MAEDKNKLIGAFVKLGCRLNDELASGSAETVITESVRQNPWFTSESIANAIRAITGQMLSEKALTSWVNSYGPYTSAPKKIAVIMAGNIPLVGFSDMLAVLVSGHECIIKPSSKDLTLTNYTVNLLKEILPAIPAHITPQISCADALIATGNDNTIRSLKAQYGDIPAIFRGTRISVAALSGNETNEELTALSYDIFSHSGLGCRNVSHIFIPENYDLKALCSILSGYPSVNEKYRSNYRQNKALSVLNGKNFTDGGFYTLTESDEPGVFLSEITYSRHTGQSQVGKWLADNEDHIQCVVAKSSNGFGQLSHSRIVNFGQAQCPSLTDYPDGIDVMKFLRTFE